MNTPDLNKKSQKEKQLVYQKPEIEIIEMEMEDGVLLSASGGDKARNYNPGGGSNWQ